MSGPLHRVLGAFENGASTLSEVATVTGLSKEMVDSAVAHLQRAGRLEAKELSFGCPSSGCGSCPSGKGNGQPGCGASAAGRGGRSVVQLSIPVAGKSL